VRCFRLRYYRNVHVTFILGTLYARTVRLPLFPLRLNVMYPAPHALLFVAVRYVEFAELSVAVERRVRYVPRTAAFCYGER